MESLQQDKPVYVSIEVRRDAGNITIEGWLYTAKAIHVHEDGSELPFTETALAIQPSVEFIEGGFAFPFLLTDVISITPAVPVTYYQSKE